MNKENNHQELLLEIKEENYISSMDVNTTSKARRAVEETPSQIKQ